VTEEWFEGWVGLGATYTVLQDVGDDVSNQWQITALPTIVVLDGDLTIRLRGTANLSEAEALVEQLLAE